MVKTDNNVGNRIKSIRKEKGLTMEQMGELIGGVKKSSINNWEKGQNLPNSQRLKKIAELGGISVNNLLYGSLDQFAYNVLIKELDSDTPLRKVVYQRIPDIDTLTDSDKQAEAIAIVTKNFKNLFMTLLIMNANTEAFNIEDIYSEPSIVIKRAISFFTIKEVKKYPEYNQGLKEILKQTDNLGYTLSAGSIEEIEQRLIRKGMNEVEAHKEAIDRYYYTKAHFAVHDLKEKLDDLYKEYEAQISPALNE